MTEQMLYTCELLLAEQSSGSRWVTRGDSR